MEVKKDALLLKLDTRELRKQLKEANAKVAELYGERNNSMEQAERDPTKTNDVMVYQAQLRGAVAQADLLEYRIKRAEVRSPYNGVILSGDVEDKVNAPVKEGHLLMEVGPISDLKVKLDVAER